MSFFKRLFTLPPEIPDDDIAGPAIVVGFIISIIIIGLDFIFNFI